MAATNKRPREPSDTEPRKKKKQSEVYVLFKETNLDDYKSRGEDWQDTHIEGVYWKEEDADNARTRLMEEYIYDCMREEFDFDSPTAPEDETNKEGQFYSLYVKHFYLDVTRVDVTTPEELAAGCDPNDDFEKKILLKPESKEMHLEEIFDEMTKGEFCDQTLLYYVQTHPIQ